NAGGVSSTRSVPVDPNWDNGSVTWNGNLVTNKNPANSSVFDLNAGATIGTLPLPQSIGGSGACVLTPDNSGTFVIGYQYNYQFQASTSTLVQYSLSNLLPTA